MKQQTKTRTAARRMTALTQIGGLMKRRLMMMVMMLGLLGGAMTAQAATLTVTNTTDTNDGVCDAADCSLREAIAAAVSGDTVVFAAPLFDTPQIININGQLDINKDLTITGKGANLLTIRNVAAASPTSRVFLISNTACTVELSGMTITGGDVNGVNGSGGGIDNFGTLTLSFVHVTGNTSSFAGGGIENGYGAQATNGNAILNVNHSTISGNIAYSSGTSGGIDNVGILRVTNSTFSGNYCGGANYCGGGIWTGFASGNATITNSTITDNEAPGANSASGVLLWGGTLTVRNTIIAANRNNSTTPDFDISFGEFTSQGYNLIGNRGVTDFNQTGDQAGTSGAGNQLDPRLLPLALNGATTPTHALQSDSPALDKGNCFGCSSDQRQFTRPVDMTAIPPAANGDDSDIGAFEAQPVDTDGDGVPDSRDNCPTVPNPEKIAFTSNRDGNFETYVINADGTNPVNVTNNAANDTDPSFSPDGTKIVFISARDGNNEIYVMNADGTNQTRLTNNAVFEGQPSFSPDGSKIIFIALDGSNFDIYVMDADGSNQTRLTNNAAVDFLPSFSPDGSQVTFTSKRDGNFEIYVMDADGSNPINLTNNSAEDSTSSFSPDGSKITFTSKRDGDEEIYVMNADGANQTNLTNNPAVLDREAAFSPDGGQIAFTSRRDGNLEIHVMRSDGTMPMRLTTNPANDIQPAFGAQPDTDGDGTGDACDTFDGDNDGVLDDNDNCPTTPNADQLNTDGDAQGNACDADDDNDNVPDAQDAFPLDPNESVDTDADGIGNNADTDDDGDGQTDADETACGSNPLDAASKSADNDADNSPDCVDADDDNDGVTDAQDAFPFDPAESVDTDNDGVGNNADTDDDNDNQTDADEIACGSNPLSAASKSPDNDNDNRPDCVDTDDDNDGVADVNDAFPFNPNESIDTDGDGIGNNADTDDDNDGQTDADETACGSNPLAASSKSLDTDGDNRPNCVDADDDNDGVLDAADNCPLVFNPDQADFDLDGIGDTCDAQTGPPRNKEQCKNGGWMRFDFPRTFSNQGDCIQFVNTGK